MNFAVGHADQHEPAASQISRRRMHYGQSESCGHRSIDRITARPHDVSPSPRSQLVYADYNGVLCVNCVDGSDRKARSPPRKSHHQQQNQ